MRVTSEMMVTGSLRRLQGRLARYERAQEALATGRWVNVPSDDPSQASRGLALRAALQSREQEVRAASDASSLVRRADGELQGAVAALQRVRELTVRAASSAGGDERAAIAMELEELQEQLLSVANGRHRDRAVFAGFQAGPAVALDPATGSWTYRGDQGVIERRVSDTDRVQVNVTADDVFGFASGADTFTMLDELRAAVVTGDTVAISGGLDRIDTALDHVLGGLATLGAAGARIESALGRTQSSQLTLRTELAEVEDVDVAEAIMDLQVEEVAYQATLQALGRSLPDTLVSFLR